MSKRPAQVLALIALAAASLGGVAYILQQHAQQAESYPAYSAFRTLPEGTSVLYQALARTPGMTAERNILPLGAMHDHDAAILLLGIPASALPGSFGAEDLAAAGNRVIIGLLPRRYRFLQPKEDPQAELLKRWSVHLAFVRQSDIRDDEEGELTPGWPMYFDQYKGWNILRKESGRPVVIERPQGKGSIVLLANAYLLSNAAMVDDRQTEFLANLIGPVHEAIFDETHFGIEQTGSIAGLARHYRLQGLFLALVLTALLFIWKSAAGFPPPGESGPRGSHAAGSVTGEDSSAAFLNLLRRNIKPEDILSTCVEAWRKMYQRKSGSSLEAAIDLAESGRKTPAQTYTQIQQVLTGATTRQP